MGNPIPALPRNTSLRTARSGKLEAGSKIFSLPILISRILVLASCFWLPASSLLSGCGPKYTYSARSVPQAVEDICQKENQIVTHVRVVGKTVGALVYVDTSMEAKGQIPKEMNETMGKVMLAMTRVALSTDLPLDFCSIVLRDRKLGVDFVVTRSLDDTRRAYADALGFEEANNRVVFEQNRVPPGTPNDSFVLKEVTLEDFLTNQIVQRVRLDFSKDSKEPVPQPLVLVDGVFNRKDAKKVFHFSVIALKPTEPHKLILGIFKTVSTVLEGYHYKDFDAVEIHDYLNKQKLAVDRESMLAYQNKKISDQEILNQFLFESDSVQEAFKLFGFNVSSEPQDKEPLLNNNPTH